MTASQSPDAGARSGVASASASVVVADDHPGQRMTIARMLTTHGFTVARCVGDADAAVRAVNELRPAAALLDIHMPGNGLVAAECISEQAPDTAVVMLTVSEDADDLFNALRAGARGYLNKSSDGAHIAHELRRVIEGETLVPRGVLQRLVEEVSPVKARRLFPRKREAVALSPQQDEILHELATNGSVQVVADHMGLDLRVVQAELDVVIDQLRFHSVDEAASAVSATRP